MKTLLEIIVKHHITNVKDDSVHSHESVQSDPSRLLDSPAVTSAVVNGTEIQGFRCGICSSFDELSDSEMSPVTLVVHENVHIYKKCNAKIYPTIKNTHKYTAFLK